MTVPSGGRLQVSLMAASASGRIAMAVAKPTRKAKRASRKRSWVSRGSFRAFMANSASTPQAASCRAVSAFSRLRKTRVRRVSEPSSMVWAWTITSAVGWMMRVDRSGEHDGTRTEATAAVRDIRRDPPAAELLGDPVRRIRHAAGAVEDHQPDAGRHGLDDYLQVIDDGPVDHQLGRRDADARRRQRPHDGGAGRDASRQTCRCEGQDTKAVGRRSRHDGTILQNHF